MSNISSQLIKDSYNYILQSDLSTGVVYRIGGDIPVNPIFISGLTITDGLTVTGSITSSGDIVPSLNNTYNLGTSANNFNIIYSSFLAGAGLFTINTYNGNSQQWQVSGVNKMQLFGSSGNLLLQSGGTFTDAGYRLDVNGTARVQGLAYLNRVLIGTTVDNNSLLNTQGTITAATAIARGGYLAPTLVASANSDTLVGLDIAPTFTNGAFTGIKNIALRSSGDIQVANNVNINGLKTTGQPFVLVKMDSSDTATFGNLQSFTQLFGVGMEFRTSNGVGAKLFNSTNNLTLQNGGTFTDNGARLQVYGNTFISSGLTANTISATTYNGYTPANDSNVVHILSAETITGVKTFSPSVTAATAIAKGTVLTPTLIASANSDVLVGLDIAPTFTNGAFTGVNNFGLRVNSSTGIQTSTITGFNSLRLTTVGISSNISFSLNQTSLEIGKFHGTTGNLTLQNGGTFTDNGARLQVYGNTFISSGLTANTISATTYQNLPATPFLPLSGGTISGATNFTNGLTANTISATTVNITDSLTINNVNITSIIVAMSIALS